MLDPDTARQIADLRLSDRPLIICDVDEVVLVFVAAFERYLAAQGFRLDAVSYGLTGNIRRLIDGTAANQTEVGRLLFGFFAQETANQIPVPGAVEALNGLAARADIVMLTNLPASYRDVRSATLSRHGLEFPVVANSGPKGPAFAEIARGAPAPVFFLDDSPSNLTSVIASPVDAHVIHFVADRRFFDIADDIVGTHLKSNSWDEARQYIETTIDRHLR